jgi:hypothetical protein
MTRPVWLALIFLIGICALAALKVSIASPAKQQAALWWFTGAPCNNWAMA